METEGIVIWDCDERTNKGHIIVIDYKLYRHKLYEFTKLDWIGDLGKKGDRVSFKIVENTAKEIRLKKERQEL